MEGLFKTSSMTSGVEELLTAFSHRDARSSFLLIQKLTEQGIDYKLFIEEIVERIRQLLHEEVGIRKKKNLFEFSGKELERLAELCNDAYKNLRGSVLPQLPLELVVLKWCILESGQTSVISDQKSEGKVQKVEATVQRIESIQTSVILNDSEESQTKDPSPAKRDQDDNKKVSSSSANNLLYQLIDAIKHENAQLAGLLRGCSIEKINDTEITIATKFEFHGKKLKEQRNIELLQKAASEISGKSVKIVVRITI